MINPLYFPNYQNPTLYYTGGNLYFYLQGTPIDNIFQVIKGVDEES